MRKPNLRPRDGARFELDEQRLADADRFIRQQVVRHVAPAAQATSLVVNQTAHGFSVAEVLYHNGTAWAKSKADAVSTSIFDGIVIAVLSPDVFIIATSGYISGLSGLTSGVLYNLSADTAGALTTTCTGIPVLHTDTTTSGFIISTSRHSAPCHFLGFGSNSASSGNVAVPSSAYRAYVEFCGGGGGGAGSSSKNRATGKYSVTSAGAVSSEFKLTYFGGGGGGGETILLEVDVIPGENISYVIGAGGAKGTGSYGVSATDGTSGSSSTVTIGGITWTALGGGGGHKATSGALGLGGFGGRSTPGSTSSARRAWFRRLCGQNGEASMTTYALTDTYGSNMKKGGYCHGPDGAGIGGNGGWESDGGDGAAGGCYIWF